MGIVAILLPRDIEAGLLIPYAQRAEELGFTELWVVEDCFFRGGIAQAGVVLASTRSIRVGIGILPAALRNAATAALEVGTLAELYPGRLEVGIGHGMPGWMKQVDAWPASPLTLLEEYVTAVRAVLSGEDTSSTGRYVGLHHVQLEARIEVPPLLAGVRGPKSLALSGRVADGTILAEPVTPEYLQAARAQIAAEGPHRMVGYNVAAVDDDPTVARDTVRPALEWIGEPDWAPHITPLPFAAELAALRDNATDRADFVRRLPDDWVDQLAVTGTPAQARGRLDVLFAAGADSIVLIPAGPDPMAALTSLARVL